MLNDITPLIIAGLLIIIALLINKVRNLINENDKLKQKLDNEDPEGYDRFVSESREWAFGYIEQAQNSLFELVEIANYLHNPSKATKQELLKDREKLVTFIDGMTKDLLPKQNNER